MFTCCSEIARWFPLLLRPPCGPAGPAGSVVGPQPQRPRPPPGGPASRRRTLLLLLGRPPTFRVVLFCELAVSGSLDLKKVKRWLPLQGQTHWLVLVLTVSGQAGTPPCLLFGMQPHEPGCGIH